MRCTVCILLLLMLPTSVAFSQTEVAIGEGDRGIGQVSVSIMNADEILGFQLTIVGTPSIVVPASVQAAGRAIGIFDIVDYQVTDGAAKIIALSSDPAVRLASGSGPVLEIDFELISQIPGGSIILQTSDVLIVDSEGQFGPVTSENGIFFDPAITLFSEVGKAAGFESLFEISCCPASFGAAWADFDLDNDPDLLQVGALSALHRNDGNGSFMEIGQVNGIGQAIGSAISPVWGDYDNDGDPDLFMIAQGGERVLLRNDTGTFSDVTASAGLIVASVSALSANWVDYNNDGMLDLYTNDGHLYRNDVNGEFTDVGSTSGIGTSPYSGTAWSDYDTDGDQDLLTTKGLFRNDGGVFFDVSQEAGLEKGSGFGGGVAWGDMNGDGYIDIFIARADLQDASLFRNDGNGTFTDITSNAGVGVDLARSASWADIDLDGDLDLLVTRPSATAGQYQLFRNDGEERFTEIAEAAGLSASAWTSVHPSGEPGQAAAWADFNLDGRPDLYMANPAPPSFLFQNRGNGTQNTYLTIRLTGTDSNRSGIGTRVTVWTGDTFQVREVRAGSNSAMDSLPLEFGLGEATQADRIVVAWPSGLIESKTDPTLANQRLNIVEGTLTSSGVAVTGPPDLPKSLLLHEPYPNPFWSVVRIPFELPRREHVTIAIYDPLGRKIATLLDESLPAGPHGVTWNDTLANGVYVVRLSASDIRSKTIVRIR